MQPAHIKSHIPGSAISLALGTVWSSCDQIPPAMPPTIIFVPGLWEGPKVFTKLTTLLQTQGYTTHIASLLSTGHTSPGKPSMNNDIAHIRSTISASVDAGEEVLLICHSAGGFLGSAAIQGLTLKARKEKELKGGVVKILFIAAGVFPLGSKPPQTPFYEFNVCPKIPRK